MADCNCDKPIAEAICGRPVAHALWCASRADPPTVELGEFTLIRMDNEWRLWCGCGDVIDLPEVVHGHCANCHVTCHG